MLHHTYYKKADLLEVRLDADVSIYDILSHYAYIEKISTDHKILKVLIDCRGNLININAKDLDSILPILTNINKNLLLFKEAIIVDKPQSTVIATIFGDKYAYAKNYIFKVFCTENAARIWLNY